VINCGMRLGKGSWATWAVILSLSSGVILVARVSWAQTAPPTDAVSGSPEPQGTTPPTDSASTSTVLDTWGTTESAAAPKAASSETPLEPTQESEPAKPSPAPPIDLHESLTGANPETGAPAHLRYTLERVEVRGNTRTRDRVILRYLKFKPGDILDVDDPELVLTRYRLLGTGFFRDVQFALRKGSRRGLVILVVDVVERNTIVINDIGMGLSSDADLNGNTRPLTAYGGIDVAETNLAGSGYTIGAALAVAQNQFAFRGRFLDPSFLGTPWMVSASLLYNRANDYFGTTSHVDWVTAEGERKHNSSYAIVDYSRLGGNLGIGRDLGTSTQLWLYYRLETIQAKVPLQAWEDRGQGNIAPIAFDIRSGRSVLSTVRATLQYDTRDHPFLPTRGWYVSAWGELALPTFGSDYDYQRFDISASHWWKIRGIPHVLRLQMFAGEETGDVPFFEQYYVGDFTDFRAPRMLGLNFERRPPPAIFGTLIKAQRYGEYAAKLGLEYRIPVYRGSRSVYGIDLFMSAGLWSLINRRDLRNPPPGYSGLARFPIDLTANVGFRMDTSAGGLTFAFSNILGFIPLHGEGS